MRFHRLSMLLLLIVPCRAAVAQRADATHGPMADSLRQKIEERFAARVQQELGLTNDQTAKLRTSSQSFGTRRRDLRNKEQVLRDALDAQLRPGIAANQDSVTKLTDALVDLRVTSAQAARDEMKDLSKFLNPVQRARLLLMRERFYHRVREAYGRGEMRGDMHGQRMRGRSWM
ncbi:MAG TPA: Spy/CpxP family protein refolding chaperone [Gemmatimonadales bacterium]